MLPRSPSTALLVGLGAGAAGGYLLFGRQRHRAPTRRARGVLAGPDGAMAEGAHAAAAHPAVAHGVPAADLVRPFPGFVVGYDARARAPRWVAERLTHSGSRGGADRNVAIFQEDPALDPRFRPTNADYAGSGYDRGHMAPAADFKGDQKAMHASFSLTNVSPQVGAGFNRDYWARFERFVKTLATPGGPPVYVITGPLYLPSPAGKGGGNEWEMRHGMIGSPPRLVSVPTHFYKVLLTGGEGGDPGRPSASSPTLVGAFAFPNAPVDPAHPLASFAVPFSALEEAAGLRFFPRLGVSGEGPSAATTPPLLSGGADLARLDGDALRVQAAGRAAGAARRLGSGGSGGPGGLLLALPKRVAGLLSGGGGGGGKEYETASVPPLPKGGVTPPPDLPPGAPLTDAPRGPGRPRADAPAAPGATDGPPPRPGWRARLFGSATNPATDGRVRHVCDAVACELPVADWWKSGAPVAGAAAPAQTGGGGGGRGGATPDGGTLSPHTHGRRRRRRRREGSLDSSAAPEGGWWWEGEGDSEDGDE